LQPYQTSQGSDDGGEHKSKKRKKDKKDNNTPDDHHDKTDNEAGATKEEQQSKAPRRGGRKKDPRALKPTRPASRTRAKITMGRTAAESTALFRPGSVGIGTPGPVLIMGREAVRVRLVSAFSDRVRLISGLRIGSVWHRHFWTGFSGPGSASAFSGRVRSVWAFSDRVLASSL